MTEFLVLLVAVLAVCLAWFAFLSPGARRPDPSFQDMRGIVRTDVTTDSSYAQRTNHMPRPKVTNPPLEGIQTPFQVNSHQSYINIQGGPPLGRLQEKTW
jgi:hypothetical protein